MLDAAEVVGKVLPVLLIIAFGSGLRKLNFLSEKAVKGLKDLVVNVSLPSLFFLAFSSVKFELAYFTVFLTMVGACFLMLAVGKGLGSALGIKTPYFGLTFTGFEAGMLGYSIFVAVFGAENTYKFAVVDLGQVTLCSIPCPCIHWFPLGCSQGLCLFWRRDEGVPGRNRDQEVG